MWYNASEVFFYEMYFVERKRDSCRIKEGFCGNSLCFGRRYFLYSETKAQPDQIEVDCELYPYQYINSAQRKGYSGTMIF